MQKKSRKSKVNKRTKSPNRIQSSPITQTIDICDKQHIASNRDKSTAAKLLDTAINITQNYYVQMAAAFAVSYAAGPYTATLTREAFPTAYGVVYGEVPPAYTPAHYLTYIPAREHACGYAYNNGTTIMLGLTTSLVTAAKLIPKAVSGVKKASTFLWDSISNSNLKQLDNDELSNPDESYISLTI